jgi:hypothetical protein
MRISILADRRDCQRSEKLVVSRLYMTVMWRPDGRHRRACAASMQRPSAQHAAQWLVAVSLQRPRGLQIENPAMGRPWRGFYYPSEPLTLEPV